MHLESIWVTFFNSYKHLFVFKSIEQGSLTIQSWFFKLSLVISSRDRNIISTTYFPGCTKTDRHRQRSHSLYFINISFCIPKHNNTKFKLCSWQTYRGKVICSDRQSFLHAVRIFLKPYLKSIFILEVSEYQSKNAFHFPWGAPNNSSSEWPFQFQIIQKLQLSKIHPFFQKGTRS